MEPLKGNTAGALESDLVFTRQQRIAELARRAPRMALTSLNQHLDLAWLQVAHARTRKNAAPGVDGVVASEYAEHLLDNLKSLLERAKSGTYHAPPVQRKHIPKGTSGQTRPIGVPTYEDKVLQRAVAMILEAIYEQDFHDGSYGFRPGRSPRQAIDALRDGLMQWGGGWILEVDIQRCFDTLDHAVLRELLQLRVRDGVLLRLIGKWLNAGVLEEGTLSYPETGSPQGGTISPLLCNVYLHYVLDMWFETMVKPRLRGKAFLVRYADDFVLVFQHEDDARRTLEVLPKRFAKYGLTLHPDKTRLVRFQRPAGTASGKGSAETFDLLGFSWRWGRTQRGGWAVQLRTARDRFRRTITKITVWLRRHRHEPIPTQHAMLVRMLRGHYNYFGRPGNVATLRRLRWLVIGAWWKWLSRRSWSSGLSWSKFWELLARFPLPQHRAGRTSAAK